MMVEAVPACKHTNVQLIVQARQARQQRAKDVSELVIKSTELLGRLHNLKS